MKYPALVINRKKIFENAAAVKKLCADASVDIYAVTKCFCADPVVTGELYAAGIRKFGDSRIENLKRIRYGDVRKLLLRIPMQSEAAEVVEFSDISLISELSTAKLISEAAVSQNKKYALILMVEMGDLREGVPIEDAENIAVELEKLPNIVLEGIGANFNCFGSVIPTPEKMNALIAVAERVEKRLGRGLDVICGGNSGNLHMLLGENTQPARINVLRLGESILFGQETSYSQRIPGTHQDVFRLDCEIIELQTKPSLPDGEIGLNAFGEKVFYEDKGIMRRAIIACGKQDADMGKLEPLDEKLEILGQSSDHMIVDATHSDREYAAGSIISFAISYGSLLSLSTSEYVHRVYE